MKKLKKFFRKIFCCCYDQEVRQYITKNEIITILRECGYKIQDTNFLEAIAGEFNLKINNKNEFAMLLAHVIHETGGFKYREEIIGLKDTLKAKKMYKGSCGLPHKSYHGRGLLMLSYPENYKKASLYLGLGDELLLHPERVAYNEEYCIKTALWYWTQVVRKKVDINNCQFDDTSRIINPIEFDNIIGNQQADHRRKIYQIAYRVLSNYS
ncbi:hypothetical protein EDEG_01574 [Edhazardia aedis USNM 41457]|uniref:Glycoside hydrolase family 19 catalytic domain-containing protein n=1 Tax=Edhazardia aedis (strain USNM 41457) TaxID=1003232 RepID=J8ZWU7_EDHAE|nr:hypothetical protein EDEG_01574 [Edhazardia aedis USNM 41457]|eukprot:EJW04138.1 hypothetical protein EDEG_01574 [Edhazardia aedis USNM 41457]